MKGIVFDVKGTIAHFRRPDTTATQMTYPFIPPTAVKGLVGAVLGIEDFITNDKVGIRLMNSVNIVSQQVSMLAKSGSSSFNRPTTMELVVNPYYRIYYCGNQNTDILAKSLIKGHSIYPTFLGSAYALTKPILIDVCEVFECNDTVIKTKTVVPTQLISELHLQVDRYYKRADGFLLEYKGKREFEKSIDIIYEQKGKSISFMPNKEIKANIVKFGNDAVCVF